jgi:hypothetical protein
MRCVENVLASCWIRPIGVLKAEDEGGEGWPSYLMVARNNKVVKNNRASAAGRRPAKAVRPTRRATGVCRPYPHRRRPAPSGKAGSDHCHKARPSFRTRRATIPTRRLARSSVRTPYPAARASAVEAETGGVVERHGRASRAGCGRSECTMPNGDGRRGVGAPAKEYERLLLCQNLPSGKETTRSYALLILVKRRRRRRNQRPVIHDIPFFPS